MAIFSRRSIQQMVRENAAFLQRSQVVAHVRRLNGEPIDALAAEWEVAILNALSKVGEVAHEPWVGSGRPDVEFRTAPVFEVQFIADITTISDFSLDTNNPIEELDRLVRAAARALDIEPSFVHFNVEGDSKPYRGGKNPRLALPARSRLPEAVIARYVTPFLARAKLTPDKTQTQSFRDTSTNITLTYEPTSRRGFSYGGLAVSPVYDYRDCTLYKTLLRKDIDFLRYGSACPLGVFVCDGGCRLMEFANHAAGFRCEDVVQHALDESSCLTFALVVRVVGANAFSTPTKPSECRMKLDFVRRSDCGESCDEIFKALQLMAPRLPTPIAYGRGAAARIRSQIPFALRGHVPTTTGYRSGWEMNSVSFSSKALLALLAGAMSLDEFERALGFREEDGSSRRPNPFRRSLESGRMIADLAFEHSGVDVDDDVVTITIGEPDAASSKFLA